jgi:ribosomal protein L6P/L9E
LLSGITISQVADTLVVSIADESHTQQKAFWGTTRAIVAHMVHGVSE